MRVRVPGLVQPAQRLNSLVHASRNSIQTITSLTYTKVNLTTLAFDTLGDFDSVNYRFIARSPGFYFVSCSACSGAATWGTGTFFITLLYKNGASITRSLSTAGAAGTNEYKMANSAGTFYLNTGDYLELYVYHGYGSAVNLHPQSAYNFLSVAGPL